jgi:hypothetical protein
VCGHTKSSVSPTDKLHCSSIGNQVLKFPTTSIQKTFSEEDFLFSNQ